jgi:hypothetical protein
MASTDAVNKWFDPGTNRRSCPNCYGKPLNSVDEDQCSILCERLRTVIVMDPEKLVAEKLAAESFAKRRCLEVHYLYRCSSCGEEPPPYDPTKKLKMRALPYGWAAGLGDAPCYQREAAIKYWEEKKDQSTQ